MDKLWMRGRSSGFCLALLVIVVVVSPRAQAAFLSVGHADFGPDSITLDTESGLQWLDVNLSLNLSFTEVTGQFGPGGTYEGFRYAAQADMFELFDHAGLVSGTFMASNFAPAQTFQSFFGITGLGSAQTQTNGLTGARSNSGSLLDGIVVVQDSPGFQQAFAIPNSGNLHSDDFHAATWGSWLIEASPIVSAPEPATLALFGLGLAGLAARRRLTG